MKRARIATLALTVLIGLTGYVTAAGKEVTLKGKMACGKCCLKEKDAKACQNVLIVKDGEKTTKYYLVDNEVSKKYHEKICKTAPRDGVTLMGACQQKDGKLVVTATKIED